MKQVDAIFLSPGKITVVMRVQNSQNKKSGKEEFEEEQLGE